MKHKLFLLLAAMLISIGAKAEKEMYAVLESDGTTMTLYYDTEREARGGVTDWTYGAGSGYGDVVTKAVFDESFKDARPTSTNSWFAYFSKLESIEHLDYLNTEEVTNMSDMFTDCYALTSLDVSHFNTDKVTDMSGMFYYSALTSLDVSHFNTENAEDMSYMFGLCYALTSLDLNSFNTENVTNMSDMFRKCEALTSLDLSSFKTDKVENMGDMFEGCAALEKIIFDGDWSKSENITYSEGMFSGCTKLVGGKGTEYDASHTDVTYALTDGLDGKPGYFTAPAAPICQVTISLASSVSGDDVNPDNLPLLASVVPLYDEENPNNSLLFQDGQLVGTIEQGGALTVFVAGYIYEFDHWSDNTGDAYRNFFVDGDINLTLYLRPRLLTIKTVCDDAQGTVSITGSPSFRYSDRNAWSATLSAQPKQGYAFAGWVPEMDWNLVDITPELILESYATLIAEGEQYGALPEELAFIKKLFGSSLTLNGADIDLIRLFFDFNENGELIFRAVFKPAGGTGIEETIFESSNPQIFKSIKNGTLLIERNGKTYTASGAEVK